MLLNWIWWRGGIDTDHDIVENKNENKLNDNEFEKVHDLFAEKYTWAKCNLQGKQRVFSESYEDDALTEMWFCCETKRIFLESYEDDALASKCTIEGKSVVR